MLGVRRLAAPWLLCACTNGDGSSTAGEPGSSSSASTVTTSEATTADDSTTTDDGTATTTGPACTDGDPAATRLTTSADPNPAAPRENVTQWNWSRAIAIDGAGGVHVAWTQLGTTSIEYPGDVPDPIDTTSLPTGRILYMAAPDCGESWSDELEIAGSGAGVDSAAIAASGDRIVVAWRAIEDGRLRVLLRRSDDRGTTWADPIAISDNPVDVSASPPSIAASGASIAVVWADGRTHEVGRGVATAKEVRLASSRDAGSSWDPVREVSVPDGYSSWTPAVAVADGAVHVAWTDERDDVGECTAGTNPCREEEYYRHSLDGGEIWGPEVRLTSDPIGAPAESWAPSIAVALATVHVAFFDRRTGLFEVYYKRSLDGGDTWEDDVLLGPAQAPAQAVRPVIAAHDADVHLAWFVYEDFPADVFHARSSDGGTSWTAPAALTRNGPSAAARLPHVAADADGRGHVVWYDTRHSDAAGPRIEIYYARTP